MLQRVHRRYWYAFIFSSAYLNLLTPFTEDAPALSSIHSFKAEISSEGKIVVTAPLDKVTKKDMERVLQLDVSDASIKASKGTVIVGGGSGAIHTIESLRTVRLLS